MADKYECDRCGLCCRKLIIEIDHLDVVREPRLLPPATLLLDGNGAITFDSDWEKQYSLACGEARKCPCHSMDGAVSTCAIYPTRPNVCVAFEAGSEQCQELRETYGLPPLQPVAK
jgi:Fe-S-cluster containining protein